MPAKWEWLDENQRIMYIEYRGNVTVQEIDDVVHAMMDQLPAGPLYIASETTGAKFPVNMIAMKLLPDFVRNPNMKHMAIVQGSALVQYLGKLLGGTKLSMHNTLDEAVAEVRARAGI
jgi:hypothetical protein